MAEVAGLPGMERLAIEEGELDEAALADARKLENIKAQALRLSEQNMEQTVRLFRTWIKQEA